METSTPAAPSQAVGAAPMNGFSEQVLYMGLTTGADQHAVSDVHGHWTWQQLDDRVGEAEAFLRSLRLPARARVVLIGPDSVWHHVLLLACARSGLIFVPVNNRYAPGDIAHVVRLVRPAIGLLGAGFEATFDDTSARHTARSLGPFKAVS